jgi:nitrogen fixation protein FixH
MQSKQAIAPNETLSQFVWTLLILGFFGVQAIVWLVALTLTANDSSQVIVSGYDEKALKWDEQRSEQNASDALGWSASFRIEDREEFGRLRQVTVHLTDREHQVVAGARIELKIFHCGHAARVEVQSLVEIEPGVYSATFKMEFAGKWDFSLVATRENERFIANERTDVEPWGATQ